MDPLGILNDNDLTRGTFKLALISLLMMASIMIKQTPVLAPNPCPVRRMTLVALEPKFVTY